jgi:hypothetical protein
LAKSGITLSKLGGNQLDYQQQNKLATRWLLEYSERKQNYITRLQEFVPLAATQYSGQPKGTDISQPTQNKGVSLAQLDADKLWLITIEDTERILSRKKKAFLDFRRLAEKISTGEPGRPGWSAFVSTRFADWHYREYGYEFVPTDRTMREWWHHIVDIAVRIAIRRGCL